MANSKSFNERYGWLLQQLGILIVTAQSARSFAEEYTHRSVTAFTEGLGNEQRA